MLVSCHVFGVKITRFHGPSDDRNLEIEIDLSDGRDGKIMPFWDYRHLEDLLFFFLPFDIIIIIIIISIGSPLLQLICIVAEKRSMWRFLATVAIFISSKMSREVIFIFFFKTQESFFFFYKIQRLIDDR